MNEDLKIAIKFFGILTIFVLMLVFYQNSKENKELSLEIDIANELAVSVNNVDCVKTLGYEYTCYLLSDSGKIISSSQYRVKTK